MKGSGCITKQWTTSSNSHSQCGAVLADARNSGNRVVSTDTRPNDQPDRSAECSEYDEADGPPRATPSEERSALAENRVDHRVWEVECWMEEEEGERSREEDQPEDRVWTNRRELPPLRGSILLCADYRFGWTRGDQQERWKANSAHYVAEGSQLQTRK